MSTPSADAKSVPSMMNVFTFRFTQEVLKEKKGNVCVSPLSVSVCLSTLLNGSKGETYDQLRKTLNYQTLDLAAINEGTKETVRQLIDAPNKPFTISNSVWLRSDFKPNPSYVKATTNFYNADFFGVPQFDQVTVNKINAWTKEKTKQRIDKIVDNVDPQTVLALVNALTFDADWETQFQPRFTGNKKFSVSKDVSFETPTMNDSRTVPYSETPTAKAIELNYKGGEYGMILVLPKGESSPQDFYKGLNIKTFEALRQSLKSENETKISLPKFKVEAQYDLKPTLSKLGMQDVFTAGDFSGVSKMLRDAKVDKAVHKTYLKLNEKGTEAAAATAIMVPTRAIMNPSEFRANRPFAYLLVNNKTGVVLFAGVCSDPR